MAGGYVINVGDSKPKKVILARPDINGNPQGEQFEHYQQVGVYQILNTVKIWGRRRIKEKPDEKGKEKWKTELENGSPIEVLTPGYAGEVEFLEWGEKGGYALKCRYIPESRSLDFDYQELVQKIKLDPEKPKEGDAFINLKPGENKFDYKKDALLISLFKVHPQNRDSKSKNPNPEVKGYGFFEITDEHVDSKAIKQLETSNEAGNVVMDLANSPAKLRVLFDIMGKREEFGEVNKLSGDLQIYLTLLSYAKNYSQNFFALINGYKKQVQDDFEKAKSYKVLDLTKDGHIAFINGTKTELIYSGIKAKGDGMVNWMIENTLEEDVYAAIQIFKKLVEKLK